MPVQRIRRAGCIVVKRAALLALWCLALSTSGATFAAALDDAVARDALLRDIASALPELDVTTNLNARELVRQRIERPRLGRFPDLPINLLPTSAEILQWEAEYQNMQVGGLAILLNDSKELTIDTWLSAADDARVFISFYREDMEAIQRVQQLMQARSRPARMLATAELVSVAGELYATAAQRLALDSRAARRYDSSITEFTYLGERVRRNSNSLFKSREDAAHVELAGNEPAVFLKEGLGDGYTQSTIREIVVPGGVALGETARLPMTPVAVLFTDNQLLLLDDDGRTWSLPPLEINTIKALFDFTNRSQALRSDAMVDIDERGRVRINAALRDTDAGYAIVLADTRPFEFVRNLDVIKSVIIDTQVNWQHSQAQNAMEFMADFEIRFLSADNMRIAQTRAALEYSYSSASNQVVYEDSWGRAASRLQDKPDLSGLGSSVVPVARYAGWVALFRALNEAHVPFLRGRYAFMKLDKSGRTTPVRI